MPVILRIAVPGNPLRRYFDYLPPPEVDPAAAAALAPGCRLRVPFGRRSVVAFLAGVTSESDLEVGTLRPAEAILDREPLLTPAVAGLCSWAAAYYQHAPGDVFAAAFSQRLRNGRATARDAWQLTDRGAGLAENALARAPRQREAL
ncbi:primosomal protein N' family DNA-binding protein, partial [Pseudohaliea rubra]